MDTRTPRLHPLSLSLHVALVFALPATAAAGQLIVNDGSTQTASGTYDVGTTRDAIAVGAMGTGSKIIGDAVTAIASGDWSRALFVDRGGRIDLSGATVRSGGEYSVGVLSGNGGWVRLLGGTISSTGVNSTGIKVDQRGSVELGPDVAVDNSGSHGVLASGTGAHVVSNGARIASTGIGAFLDDGASAELKAGSRVAGASFGVAMYGAETRLAADQTQFEASQDDGVGLGVSNGAQASITGGTVVAHTGASVLYAGSRLSLDNTRLESSASTIDGVGLLIGGGEALLRNTTVTGPNGVVVKDAGSRLRATDSTIEAASPAGGLTALAVADGASAELVNSAVTTNGATALFIGSAIGVSAPSKVFISGGRLGATAADSYTVLAGGGSTDGLTGGNELHLAHGARAEAGGELVHMAGSPLHGGHSILKIFADEATLAGDLVSINAELQLSLVNGSSLTGAIRQEDVEEFGRVVRDSTAMIDANSHWTVTGSSALGTLSSGGTVAFAPGGDFKTLTLRGDYIASEGVLSLNSALGDDASRTDRLTVHGNTSGNTRVVVNNMGGTGAATGDGIQVVQVDGASEGTFALDGRAVAGAYEYRLFKGGVADPNDGDWYLRSQALPPDPVDPTPVAPVDPTPVDPIVPRPVDPLYRPEPAAYLANQAASTGMFQHAMHDRMGEPNLGPHGDDGRTSAAWVRVVRNQMDGTTGAGQLDAGTDTSVLQIGGEIARWNGDRRFHLGWVGGTGRADTTVESSAQTARAKGKVIGYNLGVYGTWFADANDASGLYVDGWLQYGRYDNRVQGDWLAEERYDAWTLAGSVEAGWAFGLNEGGNTDFIVEPQLQAIFTDYSASKHVENTGVAIDDVDAGGLTTRLGVRVYGHAASATQKLVQPFATLNWWHDQDRNTMAFNATQLTLELPRDRYELKLGAQAQLGGGWTGWGHLGVVSGADGYRDITAQLGANYRW